MDVDFDRKLNWIRHSWDQNRRCHARRVWHGIRVASRSHSNRFTVQWRARNVTRRHDQRETKRRFVACDRQLTDQSHFNRNLFSRRDIPDSHRKGLAALFFGNRCGVPRCDRSIIVLSRLAALLQYPINLASIDMHYKTSHRIAARKRKDVGRFDRLVITVVERLPHHRLGSQAMDLCLDIKRT